MNDQQHKAIQDAISEKLGNRELICPISGDEAIWAIHVKTTTVPALTDPDDLRNPLEKADSGFPMALVVCVHCGYTMFINLLTLGVGKELGIEESHEEEG